MARKSEFSPKKSLRSEFACPDNFIYRLITTQYGLGRAAGRRTCMTTTWKVVALSFLWIALIKRGELGTDDADLRLRMAHAWWTHAEEVTQSQVALSSPEDASHGVLGVTGKRYVFYDPGQSLLMLPADWFATKLYPFFENFEFDAFRVQIVSWLVFVPLNVMLVLACFWLLRLFGFEERVAALSSLLMLLGTTVLFYAQVQFQNNQLLLFVTIGQVAILAWAQNPRARFLLLSGAALGAAVLTRTTAIIHVFTVGLFLLGYLVVKSRDARELGKLLGYWCAGLTPFVLLGRAFDYLRYGSIWTTGQATWIKQLNAERLLVGLPSLPAGFPFVNAPHVGILGVLFSPAKSIFIYDPLLLPCLVVGIFAWRTLTPFLRWYLALGLINLGLHIALTSRLDFWHGDLSWGARYHVTSVHMLMIPLLALLVQRVLATPSWGPRILQGAIVCAILVQAASVAMPAEVEYAQEEVEQPAYCATFGWSSPLEFRLGHRFKNLSCLMDSFLSIRCPAVVTARTATVPGKLCSEDLNVLKTTNRIAFQPFDPQGPEHGRTWASLVWGIALLGAAVTTGRWCYLLARDIRVPPALPK
jgi:hypothetical protein